MELDLRLGGASRQARYFLIWSCYPFTYRLQTGQISLCRTSCLLSQQIRKHVEGWWPCTTESPVVVLLYPSISSGCPSPERKESEEFKHYDTQVEPSELPGVGNLLFK